MRQDILTALSLLWAATLPAVPASAQGVLALDGPYHFGQIGSYFDQSLQCPTYGPVVYSESGTVTFQTAGTFSTVSNYFEVCVGGSSTQMFSDNGGYVVDETGVVTLDFDLSNPGTDTSALMMRADASAMVHGRDAPIDEAFVVIALRGSTGHSNASLSGPYQIVRLTDTLTGSLALTAEFGTMTFDGSSAWSESGSRQSVAANGNTNNGPYTANGSYAITANALLTIPGGGSGAISAGGDVFFVVRGAGTDVALTVGVRRGSNVDIGALAAAWGFAAYGQDLGVSPVLPNLGTGFGSFDVTATGSNSGTYQGTVFDVDTDPQSTSSGNSSIAGTVAVQASGLVQLVESSVTSDGAVSPNGTVLIVHQIEPSSGGLAIGVRRPNPPDRYGSATPGTGGIAPDVTFAPLGGFAVDGNFGFGLRVFDGRGGAPAGLLLSLGPSAGFPFFGGLILVDPVQIFAAPSRTLSGAMGAAGVGSASVFLPLPVGTEGLQFYVQAVVIDPNTPGGLSMSRGVGFLVGR